MRIKPTALLACALACALLVLPACGGSEPDPASEAVPPGQVQDLNERVETLEQEIGKLREQLDSIKKEQEASSGSNDEGTTGAAGAAGSEPTGSGDAGAGSAGAGAGAGSGSGSGSGSGGGSGSGSGSGGGSGSGSSDSKDRTLRDVCGPNPAPEC